MIDHQVVLAGVQVHHLALHQLVVQAKGAATPGPLGSAHFPPAACPNNVCIQDDVSKKFFGYAISVNDLWSTVLAAVIVAGTGIYVARKVTTGVPGKLQLLWESLIGWVGDQLGPSAQKAIPLAATLFAFILVANWFEIFWPLGHAPNYVPTPTSAVDLDYVMAITVFVYTNATAIRRAGLGRYLKHFTKPYGFQTIFNVIEELVKILSLSLRLFGNVFAGALVLALVAGLFPLFLVPFVDVFWVPFDLFIFAIQAFIFSLLTIIYYQQAVAVAEGGGH